MRNLLRVGGLLLLGGTLILVGRSWSSTGHLPIAAPMQPPRPKTRVAVFNLSDVIRNYEKFKTFQEEMKASVVPFQIRDRNLKLEGEKLAREGNDENTTIKRKKEIDNRLKQIQNDLASNKRTFEQTLKTKNEEHLKILYKDVQVVVARYAKAHDLELVLHYNDASTPADLESPLNIARKMQAGACQPVYSAPGVDITREIAAALNESLARRKKSM